MTNYNLKVFYEGREQVFNVLAKDKSEAYVIGKSRYGVVISVSKNYLSIRPALKNEEFLLFLSQVSLFIDSGSTIDFAIKSIQKSLKSKSLISFSKTVYENLSEGFSFHDSILKSGFRVNQKLLSMIKAAEESGNFSSVINHSVSMMEDERLVVKKMIHALYYPLFMISISLLMLVLMVIYLVPKMSESLSKNGRELPAITEWVLSFSSFISSKGYLIITLVMLIIFTHYLALSWSLKYREFTGRLVFSTPYVGPLLYSYFSSRWFRFVSVSVGSGTSIVDAVRSSSGVSRSYFVSRVIERIFESLERGDSISGSMSKESFFSHIDLGLVEAAERTANVEKVFYRIGKQHEKDMEERIKAFMSLFEPVLILFVGGLVLLVILSIMLPMLDMSSL
ncbi:MAG: type II secretion system F family protein [Methyloprofundus sp.]|nr:type II secretion system F family protein [Methyloprofundus sp.]